MQGMRAWKSCQIIGEGLRSDIQINCGHDGHVYRLKYVRLSIHSTVVAMMVRFLEA